MSPVNFNERRNIVIRKLNIILVSLVLSIAVVTCLISSTVLAYATDESIDSSDTKSTESVGVDNISLAKSTTDDVVNDTDKSSDNSNNEGTVKVLADELGYDTSESKSIIVDQGSQSSGVAVVLDDSNSNSLDDSNLTPVTDVKLESVNVLDVSDLQLNDSSATVSDETPVTSTKVESSSSSDTLLSIGDVDTSYSGHVVKLTDSDRDLLEHLVMGEAGGEGYIGASLVAQCIRDAIVYKGYNSVAEVRTAMAYSGDITKTPNQDVLNAVHFIFDQGGYAVQHKLLYFYAPKLCTSPFHESQQFITEYGGHRFFSTWN